MSETNSSVRTEITDGVCVITLARPETMNAFTAETITDINNAIELADADKNVNVLLITGDGKGFASGGNLQELRTMADDPAHSRYCIELTLALVKRLYAVRKPVIAAVNGPAFGAGIAFMMSADIVIASDRAKVGYSFTNLGCCPDSGASWLLVQRVGYHKAAEICFSGKALDAQEAFELGLVSRVVPHEELMATALKTAKRMAAGPVLALMLQKQVLRTAQSMTIDQSMEFEAAAQRLACYTDDFREGMDAALARRRPEFKGERRRDAE